jgi:hypothetical protein
MKAPGRTAAVASPGQQSRWSRYGTKAMLSLLVGGVFAVLLWKGALPIVPTSAGSFERVRWAYAGLAVASWFLGHVLRAGRWYWLLAPLRLVPLRRVFPLSFAGFAAVVALPLRTGEIARLLMIGRATSPWVAAGTVGAERVMDGLTLSAMLLSGLLIARPVDPLPDHIGELAVPTSIVPRAAYLGLAAFACAFVAMTVFYARREWARRATEATIGALLPKFARKIADKIAQVSDGLGFLASARVLLPFTVATVGYWVASAGTFWFLSRATGLSSMTFPEAMVVMGTLALGILLPAGPGYFGAFQLSVYAALALYHSPKDIIELGSMFVFLLYALQVGAQLVVGAVSLLVGVGEPRPSTVTPR